MSRNVGPHTHPAPAQPPMESNRHFGATPARCRGLSSSMPRQRAKVLAIIGSVLVVATAALNAANFWWGCVCMYHVRGGSLSLGVWRGSIGVTWQRDPQSLLRDGIVIVPRDQDEAMHWWFVDMNLKRGTGNRILGGYLVPLWMPLCIVMAFTAYCRYIARRRSSGCRYCGYCLDNLRDICLCPECGNPL